MQRPILSMVLAGLTIASYAQRTVGEVRSLQAPTHITVERANDTLYSSALDNTSPMIYGVVEEDGGGYIFGTNGYGDKSKARAFLLSGPSVAKEVLFWFGGKIETGAANSNLVVKLWDLNGPGTTTGGATNEAPGTVLGSVNMPITAVDTCMTLCFSVAQFASPVAIPDFLAVGFSMDQLASGDQVGVVSSTDGDVEYPEFTWEQWSSNAWYTLPAAGWGNSTMDFDPFLFLVIDDELVGVNEAFRMNGISMRFLNGNPFSGNTLQVAYDLEQGADVRAMVIDASGRILVNENVGKRANGEHNIEFNAAGWTAGHYYVTIMANGRPMTRKVHKL